MGLETDGARAAGGAYEARGAGGVSAAGVVGTAGEELEARLHAQGFLYGLAHTVFGGAPDGSLARALGSAECVQVLRALAGDCPACGPLADWCAKAAKGAEDAAGADGADGAGGVAAEGDVAGAGGMRDEGGAEVKGGARNAADAAVEGGARMLDQALSEYNRCILGLGAHRESHPWESTYTSHNRLMFQPETLAVREFYRTYGCTPAQYPKVADDHVALECAFLAHLAKRALEAPSGEARAEALSGQLRFLDEHLLAWLPRYCADLYADAPDGLYDLAARALLEFAEADRRFLANALGA